MKGKDDKPSSGRSFGSPVLGSRPSLFEAGRALEQAQRLPRLDADNEAFAESNRIQLAPPGNAEHSKKGIPKRFGLCIL
jgi:hypothetical protein